MKQRLEYSNINMVMGVSNHMQPGIIIINDYSIIMIKVSIDLQASCFLLQLMYTSIMKATHGSYP